jgi:hypothetical protein
MREQSIASFGSDLARRAAARLGDLRWVRVEIVLLLAALVVAG